MPNSIFKFILQYTYKQQIYITCVTLLSFPILYLSLELPKTIINHGVRSHSTANLDHTVSFLGVPLDTVEYLITLSFMFLFTVLLTGIIKMYINTFKGRLGEIMLRKLRFILFHQLLRFPSSHFKTLPSGQIIPMITSETEPLGGFIGDAFSLPIFQGGTLLVYISFIFIQDPILGISAISLYPIQAFIIPKLQHKINALAKERVSKVRLLSSNIEDVVESIYEIHLNAAEKLHLASFSYKITEIFKIRYQIYKKKFFMKFLNNFLNQLTPFFFYAIGGYAVLQGQVSIGALVAVIAAYKDLASPWKELLNFYQHKENVKIKYCQIIAKFTEKDLFDKSIFRSSTTSPIHTIKQKIQFSHVTLKDQLEQYLLNNLNFEIDLSKKTFITGDNRSGKEYIGQLLARSSLPSQGSILIKNYDFNKLPTAITSQKITYFSKENMILNTSIYNNITHSILTLPDFKSKEGVDIYSEDYIEQYLKFYKKNTSVDFNAAGVNNEEELKYKIINLAKELELDNDLYKFGLRQTINPIKTQHISGRILMARKALYQGSHKKTYKNLIARYKRNKFNPYANIIENIVFGSPCATDPSFQKIYTHPYFIQTIKKADLYNDLLNIGLQLAIKMQDVFENVSDDNPLFNEFSFVTNELMTEYKKFTQIYQGIGKKKKSSLDNFSNKEKNRLIQFTFVIVPGKHPLDFITSNIEKKILNAREFFISNIPDNLRSNIDIFNEDTLNNNMNILENIIFGKIIPSKDNTQEKANKLIQIIIDKHSFAEDIMIMGLEHQCGPQRAFLTSEQSEKINVIKALIKNSEVFIFNQALGFFNANDTKKIQHMILKNTNHKGLIWIDEQAPPIKFNTCIRMSNGTIENLTASD